MKILKLSYKLAVAVQTKIVLSYNSNKEVTMIEDINTVEYREDYATKNLPSTCIQIKLTLFFNETYLTCSLSLMSSIFRVGSYHQ